MIQLPYLYCTFPQAPSYLTNSVYCLLDIIEIKYIGGKRKEKVEILNIKKKRISYHAHGNLSCIGQNVLLINWTTVFIQLQTILSFKLGTKIFSGRTFVPAGNTVRIPIYIKINNT